MLAMEHYFETHTAKGRKSIALTSNEAVKQALIANIGISLIPLIGIKNELINQQLHILPVDDLPVTTHWRIVWLKGKQLSPVAQAFLDFVRENKQEIIHTYFQWYLDFK